MGHEIYRERVYGNFRKPQPTPAQRRKERAAKREGNDAEHLEHIRQLTCCIPGCMANVGIDPHHLKSGPAAKERSVGRRSSDRHCVSLCRYHHDQAESEGSQGEVAWFDAYGYPQIWTLAAALYAAPSLAIKKDILLAHRAEAEALILARHAEGKPTE